jgi:hypothetical protein
MKVFLASYKRALGAVLRLFWGCFDLVLRVLVGGFSHTAQGFRLAGGVVMHRAGTPHAQRDRGRRG